MSETRARTAGPNDLAALLALDPAGPTDVKRQRFVRRSVNANECFIVERESGIVGFGVLNYSFFEHGLIASVTISESVRYSEIIMALLRYMESRCRTAKLFATTAASNSPLQNALRKLQYTECGLVKYIDDADESQLFFCKHLEPDDNKIPEHHFGLG